MKVKSRANYLPVNMFTEIGCVEVNIHCLNLDPIFSKSFGAKQKDLKAAVAGAGGWIEQRISLSVYQLKSSLSGQTNLLSLIFFFMHFTCSISSILQTLPLYQSFLYITATQSPTSWVSSKKGNVKIIFLSNYNVRFYKTFWHKVKCNNWILHWESNAIYYLLPVNWFFRLSVISITLSWLVFISVSSCNSVSTPVKKGKTF